MQSLKMKEENKFSDLNTDNVQQSSNTDNDSNCKRTQQRRQQRPNVNKWIKEIADNRAVQYNVYNSHVHDKI